MVYQRKNSEINAVQGNSIFAFLFILAYQATFISIESWQG